MRRKFIRKIFNNRILIISVIVNLLLITGFGWIYLDSQKTKNLVSDQQTKIAELSISPTPSPVPSPTPIVYSGPSEKALRIAAGLVVRMPDGKFVTNLVRASPHRDVDFAATLFGAEEPGLMLEKPSGEIIPYTTVSNCMVDNSGFFADVRCGFNGRHYTNYWNSIF